MIQSKWFQFLRDYYPGSCYQQCLRYVIDSNQDDVFEQAFYEFDSVLSKDDWVNMTQFIRNESLNTIVGYLINQDPRKLIYIKNSVYFRSLLRTMIQPFESISDFFAWFTQYPDLLQDQTIQVQLVAVVQTLLQMKGRTCETIYITLRYLWF